MLNYLFGVRSKAKVDSVPERTPARQKTITALSDYYSDIICAFDTIEKFEKLLSSPEVEFNPQSYTKLTSSNIKIGGMEAAVQIIFSNETDKPVCAKIIEARHE